MVVKSGCAVILWVEFDEFSEDAAWMERLDQTARQLMTRTVHTADAENVAGQYSYPITTEFEIHLAV